MGAWAGKEAAADVPSRTWNEGFGYGEHSGRLRERTRIVAGLRAWAMMLRETGQPDCGATVASLAEQVERGDDLAARADERRAER